MTGKWHVTRNERPSRPKDNWPRQRGFDRYYGTIKGGGSYYDPAMLTRDNTPITPRVGRASTSREQVLLHRRDRATSRRASSASTTTARDKPFFLYVAFTSPHWPLHAPEETIAKYKGKYDAGYEPIRAARFERHEEVGADRREGAS